ncbi:glycosyl transferase family 2 [Alsobacter metallidurans]|uniref:Glycosyl transferase family 2 n=1 Tax=Alsobacter metallidurans TaxID=340221 RepID=A0A917I8H1_9HYPH|nr:glycosyltransferase family 2 protein [Alsobacter metallidurans]GGH22413.1 glycosyl transferase family 2 [Alsobacter metallidurans]
MSSLIASLVGPSPAIPERNGAQARARGLSRVGGEAGSREPGAWRTPACGPAAVSGQASRAEGRQATVAILMGVYDGARFLPAQLDSLARQTHGAWTLYASDDGSTDASGVILDGYAAAWGEERLVRRAGPRQGFAANFLAMVQDPAIEADYFAFCDQDDLWDADKLARAVAWLDSQGPDRPALYASAVRTVDENGRVIGRIDAPRRPPAFGNALVQNVAPGHTMVMNAAARRVLARAAAAGPVSAHDWLAYAVVTGVGGTMWVDPQPSASYRQHGGNAIGVSRSLGFWLYRIRRVFGDEYRNTLKVHLLALRTLDAELDAHSRVCLRQITAAWVGSSFHRARKIFQSGVFRQNFVGNLALYMAAIASNSPFDTRK